MPKSIIYLVGYRGSGKTTAGRHLARRLGWSFSDADAVLETKFARSIRQIFAEEGEASFRAMEAEILTELSGGGQAVIATGGGVVLRPENRLLLRTGFVIWLAADAETLWSRIQQDATTGERRPALAQGGLEEVHEILKKREDFYSECADLVVDTGQLAIEEVAELVCSHPHFLRDVARDK